MGPRDKERARLIFEMRKNGASHKEIAEAVGCTEQASRTLCSKNGMTFDQRMTEEDARRMVESTGFDYVGGFTNYHSLIKIRCRTCGSITEHWFRNIRDRVLAPNGWVNKDTNSLICRYCAHEETMRKPEEKSRYKHLLHQLKELVLKSPSCRQIGLMPLNY